MQCTHCGKSDWITIGNQKYCANCGEPSTTAEPVKVASDIKPALAPSTQVQPAVKPAQQPKPVPSQPEIKVVNPVTPQPIMHQDPPQLGKPGPVFSDLAKPSTPAAPVPPANSVVTPSVQANPANSFHSGPVSAAPGGVLDLRSMAQTPEVSTPEPAKPTPPAEALVVPAPPPVKTEAPKPENTPAQGATPPVTKPAPAPAPLPKPTLNLQATPAANSKPAPVAAPSAPQGTSITKFIRPAVTSSAQVASETAKPATEMPSVVATQVQAMQKLTSNAANSVDAPASRDNAFKMAMASPSTSGPGIKSIAAATLAIAIMGGYIWLNNYNSMAVKAAGQKAGIQASLPGFVPASYSLSGPIAYASGSVSMQYKSPSNNDQLTIEQHKTDWTPDSLLEFYVNKQSGQYVSVESQGLTIYLYNNSRATWVNKGIQYIISGNTKLSRADLLKIAQSL